MTWTIRGTMASDSAESAAGLKLIHDKTGQFVAFANPDHAHLIAAATDMREALEAIHEALWRNNASCGVRYSAEADNFYPVQRDGRGLGCSFYAAAQQVRRCLAKVDRKESGK